jgi:hypothetical protein
MMRTMRRLLVGLLSLTAFLTVGSPAFAMYPPPDPGSHDWVKATAPTIATSGSSHTGQIAWIAFGAAVVVVLVALAVLIKFSSRRHHVGSRQLQTS